jgi:hypothetical protein
VTFLRAAPLALALAACAPSPPAQPNDGEDAGVDGAAGPMDAAPDRAVPCFGCIDAAFVDIDAPLGNKAAAQLDSCAGNEQCHGAQPGFPLQYIAGHEFDQIRNVPSIERPELFRVAPGDPMSSYLYLKVLGDGGIDGGRMPLGAKFDPRIPALFFDWIEAGAPDAE